MWISLFYISASCFIICGGADGQPVLVEKFRDDFGRLGFLDPAKWNVAEEPSQYQHELHYHRTENVFVQDGMLHLRADNRTFKDRRYTSGKVDTSNKFDMLYGIIEWRAKTPRGKGLNPRLSLQSLDCPTVVQCSFGEILMMSVRGDMPKDTLIRSTWKSADSTPHPAMHIHHHDKDMSLDFHTYKLYWRPDEITWTIDGKEVFKVDGANARLVNTKMRIVMSLGVGGDFAHSPSIQTNFPATFLIDYVVVRQLSEDASERFYNRRVVLPVLVAVGGALVGVVVTVMLFRCIRRRNLLKKKAQLLKDTSKVDLTMPSSMPSSSYLSALAEDSTNDMLIEYFRSLEIPLSDLTLTHELLGKGEYGLVWKGYINHKFLDTELTPSSSLVAIKTPIDLQDLEQQKQFFEEMKIMTKVGRHLNIVNLVGAVTSGRLMMLLEFCPGGSLLAHLRNNRQNFIDQTDSNGILRPLDKKGRLLPEPDSPMSADYVGIFHLDSAQEADSKLKTNDLIGYSYQISRGLEYLALRNIIHRDLAARNVLVADNGVLKISDFGLARKRLISDYVLTNDQVALPIKWMAPESIMNKVYSYKSDVWSFGVLMWEIFTLGEVPYSHELAPEFPSQVLELVRDICDGKQMPRPPYAPSNMYDVMTRCWTLDCERRPPIDEVRATLFPHVPVGSAHYYLLLDEPYQNYNKLHQFLFMNESLSSFDSNAYEIPTDSVLSSTLN